MPKRLASLAPLAFSALLVWSSALAPRAAAAKGTDFGGVVKLIESHYRVKHRAMPILARMGVKASRIVVSLTRYSEYGSIKFAVFEDQDFSAPAGGADFAAVLHAALDPEWRPLVRVRTAGDAEQTYIYTRWSGKFFKILVVTIGRRDGVAVQLDVAPDKLAKLVRDPESIGQTLTDEATGDANAEPE